MWLYFLCPRQNGLQVAYAVLTDILFPYCCCYDYQAQMNYSTHLVMFFDIRKLMIFYGLTVGLMTPANSIEQRVRCS